ncbi:MAG: glycosyltransferase family 4 protein [Candidatus Paceibacterota bacterium]
MRLLLITQKADKNDPVLGFFHRWVIEFAKHFEEVIVICLEEGKHDLPANVKVFSLGKEAGRSKWKYAFNFYRHIFRERNNYDAVFIHMNQEYVLLGGIFWKIFRKKIYMWRNHHKGSEFTDMAAFFCDKIFCTSRYSYTAKYDKTALMPVGIDTSFFAKLPKARKAPRSVLFLGRIAPVKKPDLLLRALGRLARKGIAFSASIVGDALPKDSEYAESLRGIAREEGIADRVTFKPGVPNDATRDVYNAHEVSVNLSSSGMYDKTIFEAMACETVILASNENLRGLIDDRFIFKDSDLDELSSKLEALLALPDAERSSLGGDLRSVVERNHSLLLLGSNLLEKISS